MIRHLLCSAFAVCLLLQATQAQDICEKNFYDPPPAGSPSRRCVETWYRNRIFSLASNGPIASAVDKLEGFQAALPEITSFFKNESARALKMLKKQRKLFVEEPSHACNLDNKFANALAANRTMSMKGWGVMGEPCVTELDTIGDKLIMGHMRTFIRDLSETAKSVLPRLPIQVDVPTTDMKFRYKVGGFDSCDSMHFIGFRVRGVWSVAAGYTNAPLNVFKEEGHRHYVAEFLHLSNGRVTPTLMTLPKKPANRTPGEQTYPREWVTRSTTELQTWGGSPMGSAFRDQMAPAENPALLKAIERGAAQREQVEDSKTKSNLAILVLPLALTVVPVSFFADVSGPALVAYTIVTDFLSALPLGIKGVELVLFGQHSSEAMRTWIYGGRTETDLAAAETWHAECQVDPSIKNLGIAFILGALVMMVAGAALEFYFQNDLRKNKKMALFERYRNRGSRKQRWEKFSACQECECGGLSELGAGGLGYPHIF